MQNGADPEFFILSPEGKSVPAHAFFPPQKEALLVEHTLNPETYYQRTVGGKIFRDGWAVELNPRPSSCRALVYEDARGLLLHAKKMLPEGFTFTSAPMVEIDPNDMETAPEDVKTTGCSPSWDAYTGETKVPELDYSTHHKRYSGGHLHASSQKFESGVYPFTEVRDVHMYIKLCDLFIGLPLTVLYPSDGLWERREHYGQAGEFRPQKYPSGDIGVEYRTPPAQVFNHPAVYGLFTGIIKFFILPNFYHLAKGWNPKVEEPLKRAINTGKGSVELLSEVGKVPNFIDGDTVLALKERKEIHSLSLVEKDYNKIPEAHSGWSEFSRSWGLKVPEGVRTR